MTRLRVLYLNVDTLYPKAWTANLERRLLAPLAAVTQANDMCVILRWSKPAGLGEHEYPKHVQNAVWRLDDYETPEDFYKACPPAEMRDWITKTLALLESGAVLGRKDSFLGT